MYGGRALKGSYAIKRMYVYVCVMSGGVQIDDVTSGTMAAPPNVWNLVTSSFRPQSC